MSTQWKIQRSLHPWLIWASVIARIRRRLSSLHVSGVRERPPSKIVNFQTPKRLRRWAKRRLQCNNGGVDSFLSGWISSFYGSSIHNLIRSCLIFEPYKVYSSFKGLSSSLAFFGDNGFSLFMSNSSPVNHRQRCMNRATHSDKNMAMAVKPVAEVTAKKKPLTKQRWEKKWWKQQWRKSAGRKATQPTVVASTTPIADERLPRSEVVPLQGPGSGS